MQVVYAVPYNTPLSVKHSGLFLHLAIYAIAFLYSVDVRPGAFIEIMITS